MPAQHGVKDLSSTQSEFVDACRKGDLLRVAGYINGKKNKKTPLNLFRPSTPSVGWLSAIRDPASGYTPLHMAAAQGHVSICKVLAENDDLQLRARDKKECLPLHIAAYKGHLETVQLLLEMAPDTVDIVNCAQESPLHLAARHDNCVVAKELLKNEADPTKRNGRGESALDIACRQGHAGICQLVLYYGRNITMQAAVESTSTIESGEKDEKVYPLHLAARYSNTECMKVLLEAGFDIDFVNRDGSALHVAAFFGQPKAFVFLLREGINPDIRDSHGRTVLEMLQEQRSKSDITHVLQSQDGWNECATILKEFLDGSQSHNFNSSSDSGIDGHRREDSDREVIWKQLPESAMAYYQDNTMRSARYGNGEKHMKQPAKWHSNMYDPVRGTARFPMTSPHMAAQHQAVERRVSTLPCGASLVRTTSHSQRGTILDDKVFNSLRKVENGGTTLTYNPSFCYDNVPKGSGIYEKSKDQKGYMTNSVGRRGFSKDVHTPQFQTLPTNTRRIRPSLQNTTFSPIAESSLNDAEMTAESMRSIRSDSLDINLKRTPMRCSRQSSTTFNCSTLERSMSPFSTSSTSTEQNSKAPLALPEEMTGSTTASYLSNVSPDRDIRSMSQTPLTQITTATLTLQRPEEYKISSISMNGFSPDEPPSPYTSQQKIYNSLFSKKDAEKSNNSDYRTIISPSVTECSDMTVASSCSLPVISQISSSPSECSPKKNHSENTNSLEDAEIEAEEVKLRQRQQKSLTRPESSLNIEKEWNDIDGIFSSFGSRICRESVFELQYEGQVATFLRENNSQAIAVQRNSSILPLSGRQSGERDEDEKEIFDWLVKDPELTPKQVQDAVKVLTDNGYDKLSFLKPTLDAKTLRELGFDYDVQSAILNRLVISEETLINAGAVNRIEDWLKLINLHEYLSIMKKNNIQSVSQLRVLKYDVPDFLNRMGIHKKGHLNRMLIYLRESGEDVLSMEIVHKALQNLCDGMRNRVPCSSDDQLIIDNKLRVSHFSFSAQYCGRTMIDNHDGTVECRKAMMNIKSSLNSSSIVPVQFNVYFDRIEIIDSSSHPILFHNIPSIQVVCQDDKDLNFFAYVTLEVNVFYCNIFCVLTSQTATEVILVLSRAFELAHGELERSSSRN